MIESVCIEASGESLTARLVGATIENGHQPRPNARRALTNALGGDLDEQLAGGKTLSITQAGHLAINALESAIDRLEPLKA